MSKKMLKRSLALGALMAFVITGSASAEILEIKDQVKKDNVVITGNSDYAVTATGNGTLTADKITLGAFCNNIYIDSHPEITLNIIAPEITLNETATGSAIQLATKSTVNVKNFKYFVIDATRIGTIEENENEYGGRANGIRTAADSSVVNVISDVANSIIDIKASQNALYASGNGSQINVKASVIKISTMGRDEGGEEKRGHGVVATGGNVTVNATNSIEISAAGEAVDEYNDKAKGYAIYSTKGNIDINKDETAKLIVTGDVWAKGSSNVETVFSGDESIFTGAVKTEGNAETHLTLNNGATWNVTGESTVTEIGGNDANIKVEDAEASAGWVKVGEVTATNLTVATETEDSNTQETLDALSRVAVLVNEDGKEVGKAANQVQLKNAIYDNVVGNVTDNGVEIADKQVASANVSVNDMAAIGLMSWRAEMNDMNKRMGELRNANGEHGVWVRMVRGESEYNSVKNQYNQYQLGYDEKLSVDKRWTVGVALSYTDAENNFAQGNGESTNKALSIYGSKLNDDGTFVDLIAKYARLENDFETFSGMGAADYDANGYSLSAEFGKRIQQGKGLWIEPQVELTYGRVGSVDYVSENGVRVAQDSMDSLVGRIGFSLGKDIEKGNVYARASYLYDFDGETKATLNNDAVLENDLGGGWWEVGVGANINLSKATYIYADVEKTFGGEVDTNWQWNLGVRYSF